MVVHTQLSDYNTNNFEFLREGNENENDLLFDHNINENDENDENDEKCTYEECNCVECAYTVQIKVRSLLAHYMVFVTIFLVTGCVTGCGMFILNRMFFGGELVGMSIMTVVLQTALFITVCTKMDFLLIIDY